MFTYATGSWLWSKLSDNGKLNSWHYTPPYSQLTHHGSFKTMGSCTMSGGQCYVWNLKRIQLDTTMHSVLDLLNCNSLHKCPSTTAMALMKSHTVPVCDKHAAHTVSHGASWQPQTCMGHMNEFYVCECCIGTHTIKQNHKEPQDSL